jgi:hypothetical protein
MSDLRDPNLAEMPPLDRRRLRRDVERLAALGPRFCGTAGEARARALLLDEFVGVGLAEVRGEDFEYLCYVPVRADCRVLDGELELPCVGLQSTASTAAEGEAIYAGSGSAAELDALARRGATLEGRIVVMRAALPAAVAPGIAGRGAAGIVALSLAPDGLVNHLSATFYPPPMAPPWEGRVLGIPGVTVEAAAGERLLSLMSAGPARVHIEHRARYVERASANVVGEIRGTGVPQERVVIGAHYDTQLDCPGAADNAAGLAALLGMARAWSGLRPHRTVVLVAFAAEELASWGACHYVARHRDELTVAMLNLDALGPPVLAKRTIVAHPALREFAAQSTRRTGWEVEIELDAREFPFADHAPFVDAGIPACWIWRYPPPHPYYHTAGDTPRWVDFDLLAADARASAYTAFRLAQLPSLDGHLR